VHRLDKEMDSGTPFHSSHIVRDARVFFAPKRICSLPFGIKVPRQLLDRFGAIHMLQQKEILSLKHPANLRDLILKRATRSETCRMEKCYWATRLVNRFWWPDAVKSFSPSGERAHITADHWRKG
jgi:hypothetical protein